MRKTFAFNKGYEHYYEGRDQNPYLSGTRDANDWQDGWDFASEDDATPVTEDPMARRGLNDVLSNDRSIARGYSFGDDIGKGGQTSFKKTFDEPPSNSFSAKKWDTGFGRCYEKHPELKIPGTELVIYGGSCIWPVVKDADVYIGFDGGMHFGQRSWPWKEGHEFLFSITDYRAPSDADEFKKLVSWTVKQLQAGKKVHCGCIGGHGRTGTFLSALVAQMAPSVTDPISFVRENYCHKAVESSEQVEFLVKHFHCTPVPGAKSHSSSKGGKSSWSTIEGGASTKAKSSGGKLGQGTALPLKSDQSIW